MWLKRVALDCEEQLFDRLTASREDWSAENPVEKGPEPYLPPDPVLSKTNAFQNIIAI